VRNPGKRRWQAVLEDDPLAGLINLFDLWMVFSIALLLALVSNMQQFEKAFGSSHQETAMTDSQGVEPNHPTAKIRERFRPSNEELFGEGERLGTAYRLKSGEVVYVPEKDKPSESRR
jgi:hypothetical protein